MIIEPVIKDGIKEINSDSKYVFCTYDDKKNILINNRIFVDGCTCTISNIFGSDTLENMEAEISKRKLIIVL